MSNLYTNGSYKDLNKSPNSEPSINGNWGYHWFRTNTITIGLTILILGITIGLGGNKVLSNLIGNNDQKQFDTLNNNVDKLSDNCDALNKQVANLSGQLTVLIHLLKPIDSTISNNNFYYRKEQHDRYISYTHKSNIHRTAKVNENNSKVNKNKNDNYVSAPPENDWVERYFDPHSYNLSK